MKAILKKVFFSLQEFFSRRTNRRAFYLFVICIVALGDSLFSGVTRRTYVFYSILGAEPIVETRMLPRADNKEADIQRYVEEALLGPMNPSSTILFPRGTRLISFMLRDGVVFANLSEPAALPIPEGRDVFLSLLTLNQGIRRNFPAVRDVRLFIGGNEAFFEEFHGIFANSADN